MRLIDGVYWQNVYDADERKKEQKKESVKDDIKGTTIRKYRKKPVVVEAVRLNTTNMPNVADWIGGDTAKIVVESEEAWKLGNRL